MKMKYIVQMVNWPNSNQNIFNSCMGSFSINKN